MQWRDSHNPTGEVSRETLRRDNTPEDAESARAALALLVNYVNPVWRGKETDEATLTLARFIERDDR